MMDLSPAKIRKQTRRERDAVRGRIGRGRYDALVAELATVIKLAFKAGATGSIWGLEGPLRAGLRGDLCLQGWGWDAADLMARDVLDGAFRKAGAIARPNWNEGQPEWTIERGTLIERTFCANCHKPLLDGRPKFCDDPCRNAYHMRLSRRRRMTEDKASVLASRWI
ncbi:hypothetical protein D2T31_10760 [Sinirhodobacter populi]|uniref:Uncharacterized protein n=1 Tax=Paenirhodobacter populi TaxID=2306993 RepID=A0A443K9N4_9RHOB|nr:hypothetical protein [Sinirhodobacter populi]RWR29455.1 hypothetical protein D2T31_10760 [Sinirhodobacter populi]